MAFFESIPAFTGDPPGLEPVSAYFQNASHYMGWSTAKTLGLYSGDAWFKSYPGHRLSNLTFFVDFPSPSRKMTVHQLCQECFLRNPFQFISHCPI
jgi:hypothetical protein